MNRPLHPGRSSPLGATVDAGGVNFSLFSRHATGVELLLFNREDDAVPASVLTLDPVVNRSYYYWHTYVPEIAAAARTACGVKLRRSRFGPYSPDEIVPLSGTMGKAEGRRSPAGA